MTNQVRVLPGVSHRLVRHLPPGAIAKLRVHTSSVLFRAAPQWILFARVTQNDDGWYEMQGVTRIQPEWLQEAAPHVYQRAAVGKGEGIQ